VSFPPYAEVETPAWPEARDAVLALIADTLRAAAGEARGNAILSELDERLGTLAPHVFAGTNPRRPDVGDDFDRALDEALARRRHNGAVHVELGTWTAFPEERVAAIVEREGLAELVRVDLEPRAELDVAGDVRALPLCDASADSLAHNSLLEHVQHPHAAIHEAFRVLRPGGVMHVVTPFVWNLHRCPADYLRYTPEWYLEICREAGFVEIVTDVRTSSGLYNVLHNASKDAIVAADGPDAEAARALHLAVITLLATLIPLDRRFESGAEQWFHSVRMLAVKPGRYEPHRRPPRDGRRFADRSLDLLECPATRTALRREGDEVVSEAGTRYPVVGGVPNLVVEYVAPHASPPTLRRRARHAVGSELNRRLGPRLGPAVRRAVKRATRTT
jgi:SAM-dependent methyltransferase